MWIDDIGRLFAANQLRLAVRDQPLEWARADRKLRVAVEKMREQCEAQRQLPSLAPPCRKVLKSLARHWPGLTVFVDQPEVAMDNNAAERALRNPVWDARNYYGSGRPLERPVGGQLIQHLCHPATQRPQPPPVAQGLSAGLR